MVLALGYLGKNQMVITLGMLHATLLLTFFSISANARPLILNANSHKLTSVLSFRLSSLVPIIATTIGLALLPINTDSYAIFFLVLTRKSTEWLLELFLFEDEKNKKTGFAYTLILSDALLLLFIFFSVTLNLLSYELFFSFWCITPLVVLIFRLASKMPFRFGWERSIYNHALSTLSIGLTAYLLRLIVVSSTAEETAASLFIAFLIGSAIPGFFGSVLLPTFNLNNKRLFKAITQKLKSKSSLTFVLSASTLCIFDYYLNSQQIAEEIVVHAVIYSVVGGIITLFAVAIRNDQIQNNNKSTLAADFFSNSLIFITIAIMPNFFGETSLSLSVLIGGVINYIAFCLVFGEFNKREN